VENISGNCHGTSHQVVPIVEEAELIEERRGLKWKWISSFTIKLILPLGIISFKKEL
jgi:hypothetical protein